PTLPNDAPFFDNGRAYHWIGIDLSCTALCELQRQSHKLIILTDLHKAYPISKKIAQNICSGQFSKTIFLITKNALEYKIPGQNNHKRNGHNIPYGIHLLSSRLYGRLRSYT